jgi:hypothetical protein
MKKALFLALCLSLFSTLSKAQSLYIDASKNDNYTYSSEKKLNDYVYDYLAKQYKINENSFLGISWQLDLSKTTIIEGMNSQLSGSPRIVVRLTNKIDNSDSVFYYTKSFKTTTKVEIVNALIDSYIAEKTNLNTLNTFVSAFYDKNFGKKCDKAVVEIKKKIESQSFTEALHLAAFFQNTSCKKNITDLKAKALEEYGKYVCENEMQRIKVLANSGIEYQMIKAIDLLYRIPPKSSCSNEVIKVSKEIGDYLLKKSANSKEDNDRINILIKMQMSQDINTWNGLNMF